MEKRAAVLEVDSDSIKETKSQNLLKLRNLGKLKMGSKNQMHLTWSHVHKQCMASSGCSSHKLQTLFVSTCRICRLYLIGRHSPEARHMKCLTLFGTCNFQIPFHTFELDVLGKELWVAIASNLYALLTV